MSAVIILGNHMPNLAAVRDAINARARSIGASDKARRHAVAVGVQSITFGHSVAWAVAEACRHLQGKPPVVHGGYPTPPEAA